MGIISIGFGTVVSIHAPRVEGDVGWVAELAETIVSIHAPRVEGDEDSSDGQISVKGFNPRPPGGGRHQSALQVSVPASFNPRPPGGGRLALDTNLTAHLRFQSTPPGWRATR